MSRIANNIIERLKSELGIKTDKALCKLLDIKSNTLSTWRKRETLSFTKVLELCENFSLDLNFIFFGDKKIALDPQELILGKPSLYESNLSKISLVTETKITNKNRNLGVFLIEKINLKEKSLLYITQKVSPRVLKNTQNYMFELLNDTFLYAKSSEDIKKDQMGFVTIQEIGEDNTLPYIKLGLHNIKNVWIVLEEIVFNKKTNLLDTM